MFICGLDVYFRVFNLQGTYSLAMLLFMFSTVTPGEEQKTFHNFVKISHGWMLVLSGSCFFQAYYGPTANLCRLSNNTVEWRFCHKIRCEQRNPRQFTGKQN